MTFLIGIFIFFFLALAFISLAIIFGES